MSKDIEKLADQARRALGGARLDLAEIIDRLVVEQAWKKGHPSFGDFAVAENGLDAKTNEKANLLLRILVDQEHFRETADYLRVIKRQNGRPKTRNESEGFEPFFSIPTSLTSKWRQISALAGKAQDVFELVCAHQISLREGVKAAGLIPTPPEPSGQTRLEATDEGCAVIANDICRMFDAAPAKAQEIFIEQSLEPIVGGLIERWRDAKASERGAGI